jgi:monoamine oxidase
MYDTIIIGGGISGIYCALHLKNILLLEKNDYWGGRIKTHYEPQYEIGAGRFHKNHTRLWSLIQQFKLTPIPIPSRMDYIDEKGLVPHVEDYLLSQLKKMKLQESLRNMTFVEYCHQVLGNDAIHFINAFGYCEVYYKNAYDELKALQMDYLQGDYYILKEGLSELCHRMIKEIKGDCILNHRVKSIERNGDFIKVDGYEAKKVIVTIPPSLFKYFPILSPYDSVVSNLKNGPLLRVYAKYPKEWVDTLHNTTTSHGLRHIIPIRDGILMVAYTEDREILPFLVKGKLKSESAIRTILRKEIKRLFQKNMEPEWVRPYLWDIGTHAWLPGKASNLLKHLPEIDNIKVCGEAFSVRQAWVEGALESAERIL